MRWGPLIGIVGIAAVPHLLGSMRTSWLVGWFAIILLLGFIARWRAPQLLLAVIAIVFPIEIVDFGLRAFGDHILYYNMSGRYVRRRPEADDLWNYHKNVVDTLQTYGDATDMGGRSDATEDHEVHFVTDGYGFRNMPAAAERSIDLLFMGDSFGAAANTTQSEGIASLLGETRSVYNLSVSGAGPREHWLTLLLELDRIAVGPRTQLVWLIFEGNDLEETSLDDLEVHAPPGILRRFRAGYKEFRKRSPVRQLGKGLLSVFESDKPLPIRRERLPDGSPLNFYTVYDQRRTLEDVHDYKKYSAFSDLFGRIAQLTRERGLDTLVAIAPTKDRTYPTDAGGRVTPGGLGVVTTGFAEAVSDLCAEHDLRCLDLLPWLSTAAEQAWRDSRQLLWWRDDTHWNARGHAAAAAAIAEHLNSDAR